MTTPKPHPRHFSVAAAAIAVSLLSTVIAQPVMASETRGSTKAMAIEKETSDVGPRFDQATVDRIAVHPDRDTAITGTYLRIPSDPRADIIVVATSGQRVVIGLPGDGAGDDAIVTPDGSVVFRDIDDDTDLVVQAQGGGGARMITVIRGADAPHAYEFPIRLATNQSLSLTRDGGAVVRSGETVLIEVPPPWAYDSNGDPVGAKYTIDDDTLTLSVAHDGRSAYPIIADPWWKRALIGSSFGFFGVAVCIPFGPVGAAICSVLFSSASSTLSYR